MRILVTGGTGFVGGPVLQALSSAGHSVRLALRTDRPGLRYDTVVVGDIGAATDWRRALEAMDAVVHLAARAHVMRDHAGGAEEYRRTNTEGTLQLAHAAAAAGVRRFVFLSTIKVNGEATTERPFRADDAPNAADPYSQSKLAAETGLMEIGAFEPVIIRPPLVHGPGAKGNLARLCRLAQSGWPVPFGGIENRRDLVGVVNLADLIERCVHHPLAAGQVFLVSDGHALSTPQLYRLIAQALGRPARMLNVPVALLQAVARPIGLGGELDRLTQSLQLDVAKTRELLGWEPAVSAEAGIAEMARASRAGGS
jgi:nucleoside-diphosphate-sugar epimerase